MGSAVVDIWGEVADDASGNLPPSVVLALIERLSGGDPNLIGPAGGRGLMQIHPNSAAPFGVTAEGLLDPFVNVDVGVSLLEQRGAQLAGQDQTLLSRLEDLGRLTLGAYWFGPGKILSTMRQLGAGATAAQVLGQPGLEQMRAFVADLEGRQKRIEAELTGTAPPAGSVAEDAAPPLTGPGAEAPAAGADLSLVAVEETAPRISGRALLAVAGAAAIVIGGVLWFRNREY